MQLWTINRARATIGGPSLESRTPCNAALFHWTTTSGVCPNNGTPERARLATAKATTVLLRQRQRVVVQFFMFKICITRHLAFLIEVVSSKRRAPQFAELNVGHESGFDTTERAYNSLAGSCNAQSTLM